MYKITNKINGKVYIGQTILSFKRRCDTHKNKLRQGKHYNSHLQSSWFEYGENNFIFEIIETSINCKNLLDEREQYWIKLYNSTNQEFGYNIESGGNENKMISQETRLKLSKAHKGRKYSSEINAKNSASKKGRVHSAETRAKISQSMKGKSPSPEHREKLSMTQTLVWERRKKQLDK